MDRRHFLKTVGLAGASTLTASALSADEAVDQQAGVDKAALDEQVAVLVDITRCVGCRYCEEVCAEANGLPIPDSEDAEKADQQSGSVRERKTTATQLEIVNRYETDGGAVFVRKQCMHCLQPACASACLTKAMLKTKEGPVIWRESKCMGCRFCMISCPFDIPKFEYDSPIPKIRKCALCWQRLQKGEKPACVENCPAEALEFGKRADLIEEARKRIHEEPDRYVHHIYGEHEAGGTSWLYLSPVPFEELGFRTDIGTTPYPELTTGFLYSVPVVLTMWPAFLLAVSKARREKEKASETAHEQPKSDAVGGD